MQKERLLALACWLEGGAHHKLQIHGREVVFDMANGIKVLADVGQDFDPNTCGTACCIAGAAVEFFAPERAIRLLSEVREEVEGFDEGTDEEDPIERESLWDISLQAKFYTDGFGLGVAEIAENLLGLTTEQARKLFVPNNQPSLSHSSLRDFNDPARAARVIRHGVATGQFDWDESNWETA